MVWSKCLKLTYIRCCFLSLYQYQSCHVMLSLNLVIRNCYSCGLFIYLYCIISFYSLNTICPSCLYIYLSCLSIYLSIYLSVYLSIYLSICPYIYLSVSLCLSICLSICPDGYLLHLRLL
jgi:hypothetical protein